MHIDGVIKYFKIIVDKYKPENFDFSKIYHRIFNDYEDVIVIKNETDEITVFGGITKKLREINPNIILIFNYKYLSPLSGEIRNLFEIIYNDNGYYIEYYIDLNDCFKTNRELLNVINFIYLSVPNEQNSSIEKHASIKDALGEKTYDLFVELMLEKTNNKLKNSIYKVF